MRIIQLNEASALGGGAIHPLPISTSKAAQSYTFCIFVFVYLYMCIWAIHPPPISTSQAAYSCAFGRVHRHTARARGWGGRLLGIAQCISQQCILESPETVTARQLDCQWVEIVAGRR